MGNQMNQIIKNLASPEKRVKIRSEKKSKRNKDKVKFEIIYNTCTICKKEIKELFLCDECKSLVK
jgi:hypothetical protein